MADASANFTLFMKYAAYVFFFFPGTHYHQIHFFWLSSSLRSEVLQKRLQKHKLVALLAISH